MDRARRDGRRGRALAASAWGLVIVAGALAAVETALPAAPLSLNQAHLAWLTCPGRFFIPEPLPAGPGVRLRTNPELSRLDNGKTVFLQRKRPGAFRIFCVGGSTTRGWPFHRRFSYPALLSQQLRDLLPGREVEVINAGFMASDSSNDRALVRELLRYDPDLLLVYEGRNDLVNLPFHAGWRARLLPAHAWLLRRSTGYRRLCRALRAEEGFDHARAVRSWSLQGLGRDQESSARRLLSENLTEMASMARRQGCGLILLTQAWEPAEDSMGRINVFLRQYAGRQALPLVDVGLAFAHPPPSLGRVFLPQASHPDLPGYILMTAAIREALAQSGLLAAPGQWRSERLQPARRYLSRLSVTPDFLAQVYSELASWYGRMSMPKPAAYYSDGAERMRRQTVSPSFWPGFPAVP